MKPKFVYLDDTPGETRGIICDDVGFQLVLTRFDGEDEQERLEARSVGRVARLEADRRGAFVELRAGQAATAFLPLSGPQRVEAGQKIEVQVVSERREMKGVVLGLRGPAEGEPRLLSPGPTVEQWLERLAPGMEPIRGLHAIDAGWRAVQEADGQPFLTGGLSVTVERTRAMVTADIDYNAPGSRLTPRDRLEINRKALARIAQTLRLRSLGGLVAIDLLGVGHDGDAISRAAKSAFGPDPEIAYGPVNRFGVLMISLPWRFTPLAERLYRHPASRSYWPRAGAAEATRRLRHALLSDTTTARVAVRCPTQIAELAAPLVAQLGPRAHLKADDSLRPGEFVLETE